MELITLSKRALSRLQVAQQVLDGNISVIQGAHALSLSTRQVKRLTRQLRIGGAETFASRRLHAPPNNAFDPATKARVLELAQTVYHGFGPTFLTEKLAERDGITLNRETARQWLIGAHVHRPRKRRQHPRPLRERRPRIGELIQADGSPHHWFEDRGDPCSLLLYIDDATSMVLGGLFVEHESTDGYFTLFERAFIEHGLPQTIYTDKHGIFRINHAGSTTDEETQLQRALRELDIEQICANSPQAKGRVERANRTYQDRCVKEMRLAGIATIQDANAFLPGFIAQQNLRFAVAPQDTENAHRHESTMSIQTALTKKYERVLTAELTFQLHDTIYAIDPSPHHRLRKGMRITVSVSQHSAPFILVNDQLIHARLVGLRQRTARIVESKQLNATIDQHIATPKPTYRPPKNHPWRAGFYPPRLPKAPAEGDISELL